MMLYRQYADRKPVMLFDIQEQRVYALSYPAYRAELSKRLQGSLKRLYEHALADGDVVVFIRSNGRTRGKIVLVPFPFDDLATQKAHPPSASPSR